MSFIQKHLDTWQLTETKYQPLADDETRKRRTYSSQTQAQDHAYRT
jgi:hypothetical protein